RAIKDPADAHQRGQFLETYGFERLLLIVANAVPSSLAFGGGSKSKCSSARRRFVSSPSQRNSYENAASHRGWLAREAMRTRSSDCGGTAWVSRFSFAQASGWLRIGKRCERCGCHDRAALSCRSAAGFRRRALFWKVDAGLFSLSGTAQHDR